MWQSILAAKSSFQAKSIAKLVSQACGQNDMLRFYLQYPTVFLLQANATDCVAVKMVHCPWLFHNMASLIFFSAILTAYKYKLIQAMYFFLLAY